MLASKLTNHLLKARPPYTLRPSLLIKTPTTSFSTAPKDFHATTVLNVRKDDTIVMVADGQVSLGDTIFKTNVRKLRRVEAGKGKPAIVGFAGSTADCMTLIELLEKEFEQYPGQTLRACLNLASRWRTTKMYARMSASILVSDADITV